MPITLDGVTYATRRPSNLDDQLIETTGCNTIEIAGMLGDDANAGAVARALRPFLSIDGGEVPEMHDLAAIIKREGVPAVVAQVRPLFARAADAAAATSPAPGAE